MEQKFFRFNIAALAILNFLLHYNPAQADQPQEIKTDGKCTEITLSEIPVANLHTELVKPLMGETKGWRLTQIYNTNCVTDDCYLPGHNGVDVGGEHGSWAIGLEKIRNILDGKVLISIEIDGWGNSITVVSRASAYSEELITISFHHLDKRFFAHCSRVYPNDLIGMEGKTGKEEWDTHLHFTVRRWANLDHLLNWLDKGVYFIFGEGAYFGHNGIKFKGSYDPGASNISESSPYYQYGHLSPEPFLFNYYTDYYTEAGEPEPWAYPYVIDMRRYGIEFGLWDGSYGGLIPAKRREVVRWLKIATDRQSEFTSPTFDDVGYDDPDLPYIEAMTTYPSSPSVVDPYHTCTQGSHKFCPDDPVNRAEALKMIVTAFHNDEYNTFYMNYFWLTKQIMAKEILAALLGVPMSGLFQDFKLDDWYASFVYFGVMKGIVALNPYFNPAGEVTREEMAKWIILGYKTLHVSTWDLCSYALCPQGQYCDTNTGGCVETASCIPSESQECEVGGGYTAVPCPEDCNGHGLCEDGICLCDESYGGESCDECAVGYTGYPTCISGDCPPCPDTDYGEWSACGGFANTCDETGTRQRMATHYECMAEAGVCFSYSVSETETCSRDTDGISCGGSGAMCVNSECVPGCVPDCAGKECGDDGCGGSCGICTGCASECVNSFCQAISFASYACYNDDVWWFDSCSMPESVKEDCVTAGMICEWNLALSEYSCLGVDLPPYGTILFPPEGSIVEGTFQVTVEATDDVAVNIVTVQITNGPELVFEGSTNPGLPDVSWSTSSVNVSSWEAGTFYAALWLSDGVNESVEADTVTFEWESGVCTPNCAGKECGSDGCEGSCGSCTGCESSCVNGTCQAVSQASYDCYNDDVWWQDSCGQWESVKEDCLPGQECQSDQCVTICTQNCVGKECGGDGCGGQCPPGCSGTDVCDNGQCVPDSPTCTETQYWDPISMSTTETVSGITLRVEFEANSDNSGIRIRVCKEDGSLSNSLYVTFMESAKIPPGGNMLPSGVLDKNIDEPACTEWCNLDSTDQWTEDEPLGGWGRIISPYYCNSDWNGSDCSTPPDPGCGYCWFFNTATMTRTCKGF